MNGATPSARHRHFQYAGLWTLGIAVPAVVLAASPLSLAGHPISYAAPTLLGIWGLFYPLYVYRLHLVRIHSFALLVALAGITVAAVSVVTGWGNGLTDEPYAMPVFIQPILHLQNPYVTGIYATYNQYGTTYQIGPVTYIYLPLLIFFQPFAGGGTGYKVFAIATWALTLFLVRKDDFALVALGQPWMALLAASGFNDFPALLLLTLAFVGLGGKRQKWAEYLALGCKQFANVLVLVYYGILRDWKRLGITAGVTVAWLLPFLVFAPAAVVCGTIPILPGGCNGSAQGSVLYHLNYWAWPIWVLAIFFVPLRAYYHRAIDRVRGRGGSEGAEAPKEEGPTHHRPGADPAPEESSGGRPSLRAVRGERSSAPCGPARRGENLPPPFGTSRARRESSG